MRSGRLKTGWIFTLLFLFSTSVTFAQDTYYWPEGSLYIDLPFPLAEAVTDHQEDRILITHADSEIELFILTADTGKSITFEIDDLLLIIASEYGFIPLANPDTLPLIRSGRYLQALDTTILVDSLVLAVFPAQRPGNVTVAVMDCYNTPLSAGIRCIRSLRTQEGTIRED